jgi:signal transduction histidine kinase
MSLTAPDTAYLTDRRPRVLPGLVVRVLALSSLALGAGALALRAAGHPGAALVHPAPPIALLPLLAVAYGLLKSGQERAASLVMAAGLYLVVSVLDWQAGNVCPEEVGYGMAVLVAALLLGARWGLAAAGLSAATHVLLGASLLHGATLGMALATIGLLGARIAHLASAAEKDARALRASLGERTADLVALRRTLEEERAAQDRLRSALDEQALRCRSLSALSEAWAYGLRVLPGERFHLEWLTDPFTRVTGYRPEDLRATRDGWLGAIHPEDRPAVAACLASIVRTGEAQRIEYRITTPCGQERQIRDHAEPVWDVMHRRVIGVRGAAQDISEAIESQKASLEAERLAVVERMAATLSHEINNPLQAVLGCLGLVHEAIPEDELLREYVRISSQELRRAADIVRRLRELCAPVDAVHRRRTDLGALVREAIDLYALALRAANVEVRLDLAAPSPEIDVVRDRLRQVFLNLVDECLRAMPEGGVLGISSVWSPSPAGVEVRIAARPTSGSSWAPWVDDPAAGTPAERPSLARAVTRHIVEQHGGHLSDHTDAVGDHVVAVWLPVASEPVAGGDAGGSLERG